jgi:hypothetical protein
LGAGVWAAAAGANFVAVVVPALAEPAAAPPPPVNMSAIAIGTSGTRTAIAVTSARGEVFLDGVGSGSLISTNCCLSIIGATPLDAEPFVG